MCSDVWYGLIMHEKAAPKLCLGQIIDPFSESLTVRVVMTGVTVGSLGTLIQVHACFCECQVSPLTVESSVQVC